MAIGASADFAVRAAAKLSRNETDKMTRSFLRPGFFMSKFCGLRFCKTFKSHLFPAQWRAQLPADYRLG